MNTDDPQPTSGEPPEEINVRIEQLTKEYLSELQKDLTADFARWVAKHPELAPHLEARLKLCRAIFLVTRQSHFTEDEVSAASTLDLDRLSPNTLSHPFAFRIRCPHCGHRVQVIDEQTPEVVCHSCGSSVKVTTRPKPGKLTAPPMPQKLGHFEILRVLGEGGFGIVYLGHDPKLERLVAIKVPRNRFFGSIEEESRFFREAKHVAQLRHPNIAQVYEISDNRLSPFIASEYIDGMTLRDHAKNRTLSFQEMVEIMVQVAEAVEFAHQRKIVHRDLKTSNILIGPNQRAYVVDFGLSRRDDVEMTVTIDGALVGTLQYMAPEQAASQGDAIGPHSDVYSLGVILYELLCNELPFHGTKRMLIDQVIHDEPRSPRRLNENVPKDLETIAMKAMAKKPTGRYATAQDLAEDLKRWLRSEPIRARPISTLARSWSWCRRHPTVASLATAVATLLLLATGLSIGWGVEQSRRFTIQTQARLDSERREAELLTQNGMHALEQNDLAKSAFWLTEALSLHDTSTSRVRLGMIQDRLPKLVHLWSTSANVDIIAFDKAGKHVAVAAYDGQVQVFNLATRLREFNQTFPRLSQMELSPSGQYLIVCGNENHAQLWDVSKGVLVQQLAHTDYVVSAHFHPDSNSVVTGGFDGFARIWNTADGGLQAEHKFETRQVASVDFPPVKGQVIVTTHGKDDTKQQVAVWDHESDKLLCAGLEHDSSIIAIQVFDEGKRLHCASRSGTISRWQLPSGEAVGEPLRLPTTPSRVFFEQPDQAIAITDDMVAQIWDLQTGQPLGLPIRGRSNLASAATDPAHNLLALGSNDGWLGIYWQLNGAPAAGSLSCGEHVSQLQFHPDSRQLAVGSQDGVLQIWDLAAAAPTALTLEHSDEVRNALYTRDGQYCFTIDNSGQGHLWNTATGQKLDAVIRHDGTILDCWLSEDGKLFVTAGADKTIKLWNTQDGSPLGEPLVHESPVTDVAIHTNGDLLIAGCRDGTISFWTIGRNDPPQQTVVGKHADFVAEVAFSPKGDLAISTSENGEMLCWDTATKRAKYGRFPNNAPYSYCGFMPDGQTTFTCDAQNAVKLWSLQNQTVLQTLPCIGSVNMALWYEQGRRLVTCETSGTARLWHKPKNAFQLQSIIQHPAIQSMRWAALNQPGSQLALSGGILDVNRQASTGACILWDLAEDRPLAPPLLHLDFVRRVAFHPEGHQLLTASFDKTARLWQIVENELPAEDAKRIARLAVRTNREEDGLIRVATPEEQSQEFEALRKQHPKTFACDAEELRLWEIEVRLHNRKKFEQ